MQKVIDKILSESKNSLDNESSILLEGTLKSMAAWYRADLSEKTKRGTALKKKRQLKTKKLF